jgi:hypothetical protein
MHLIDDAHRDAEAAKQIDTLDAREREYRACVRNDYGDIPDSAGHKTPSYYIGCLSHCFLLAPTR